MCRSFGYFSDDFHPSVSSGSLSETPFGIFWPGASLRIRGAGEYLEVFQLCRSLTLLAAKGAKVQAIDTVYTSLKILTVCGAPLQLVRFVILILSYFFCFVGCILFQLNCLNLNAPLPPPTGPLNRDCKLMMLQPLVALRLSGEGSLQAVSPCCNTLHCVVSFRTYSGCGETRAIGLGKFHFQMVP